MPSDSTTYRAKRLIVGDGTVMEDAEVSVANGVITRIGRIAGPGSTPHDGVVDLGDATVMPTIVNPHGHIGYMKNGVADRAHFSRENVVDHLRRLAYYGVSVFQSLGTDRDDVELSIRDEQRAGRGPTDSALLMSAGNGLVAPTPGEPNGGPFFATDVIREVSSPDQARAVVQELAGKQPDAIKFWIDSRMGTKEVISPEVARAIVEEAHAADLKAVAHIYGLDDAKTVVRAGADGMAHMVRDPGSDQELLDMLIEKDVFVFTSMSIQRAFSLELDWMQEDWVTDTVPMVHQAAVREQLERFPAEQRAIVVAEYPRLEAELRRLHEHGVRYLLSSDTGLLAQYVGVAEHREMQSMVDAGIPPGDVIRASTLLPAQMLGLPDRGSLAVGKRADLLVLDGNPIEDITQTRNIRDVYLAGQRLDREAMRADFAKSSADEKTKDHA